MSTRRIAILFPFHVSVDSSCVAQNVRRRGRGDLLETTAARASVLGLSTSAVLKVTRQRLTADGRLRSSSSSSFFFLVSSPLSSLLFNTRGIRVVGGREEEAGHEICRCIVDVSFSLSPSLWFLFLPPSLLRSPPASSLIEFLKYFSFAIRVTRCHLRLA